MSAGSTAQIIRCQKCGTNNRVSQSNSFAQTPICGRCKTLLVAEARPVMVTDANYATEVESSPLPVLLDLWAPWCGPCRILAPIIDQIAKETVGRIQVGKLNVDENPQTAARFHIQGIPTLLILKNGREVDRIVGVQSKEVIQRKIQAII